MFRRNVSDPWAMLERVETRRHGASTPRELDYDAWFRWCYDTCRLFGASPELAGEIASIFVRAVKAARKEGDNET